MLHQSHISFIIHVFLDGVYCQGQRSVLPQSLLTCHSLLELSLPSIVYLSVCVCVVDDMLLISIVQLDMY